MAPNDFGKFLFENYIFFTFTVHSWILCMIRNVRMFFMMNELLTYIFLYSATSNKYRAKTGEEFKSFFFHFQIHYNQQMKIQCFIVCDLLTLNVSFIAQALLKFTFHHLPFYSSILVCVWHKCVNYIDRKHSAKYI